MPLRVAVRVRDAEHARIPWAIASHPDSGMVGMLGHRTPSSWRGLVKTITSLAEYDVIVDPDPKDRARLSVTSGSSTRAAITHASPEGLARALATRISGATPAWTTQGKPLRSGRWFTFPEPLGPILGAGNTAPTDKPLAGVGAFGRATLAVVDDPKFLGAVTIAAGALVADMDLTHPTPVWERAEAYIAACEDLGLVIAESVSS